MRATAGVLRALGLGLVVATLLVTNTSGGVGAQAAPTPSVGAPTGDAFHFEVGASEPVAGLPATLLGMPDDHVSFLKNSDGTFRLWASTAAGGLAVVLKADSNLQNFIRPIHGKILGPPGRGTEDSFDHDYAAPGQVVRDPSDATKLYMLYEAESLCYGTPPNCPPRSARPSTFITVGMAHADDPSGDGDPRTWTGFPQDPNTNQFGRTPALASPDAKPPTDPGPGGFYGLAIPSGMIDPKTHAFYAFYTYYPTPDSVGSERDARIEVARASSASLRAGVPKWFKWNAQRRTFDVPWNGRSSAILPQTRATAACRRGEQQPGVSYNTALGRYLMLFTCNDADFYYSTATSMEAQDWTPPRFLAALSPDCGHACGAKYPSPVSLDQPSSSTTGKTGFIYFSHAHHLWRRSFEIKTGPGG